MAVYVDALRDWGWRLGPSCHMVADTEEELHRLAASVGLKRQWFQSKASTPHYDLTESRRRIAVRLGAAELDDSDFADLLKRLRRQAIEAKRKEDEA